MIRNKYLLLKIPCYFIVLICFIGWFRAPAIDLGLWSPDESFEFPLGMMMGIAVDSKQLIYCATNYSRIQIYDKKGNFIRGWSFDTGGGYYKIKADKRDRLHVVTIRGYMHYIYNAKGKLIFKERRDDKYVKNFNRYRLTNPFPTFNRLIFGELNKTNDSGDYRFDVYDKEGNLYMARGLLFPKVYKLTPDGVLTVIISVPWHKWIFMAPLASILLFIIAAISYTIIEKIEKRQAKKRAEFEKDE